MKTLKTIVLSMSALALMVACANDDKNIPQPQPEPDLKGLTEFAVSDNATRTAGKHSGTGLDFFWTAEDKIWVTDDDGILQQSSYDDIQARLDAAHETTTAKAKFYMPGKFGAVNAYKVRYTGKNGVQDKVTIAALQSQSAANNALHIGESGDCGIANATAPSEGGHYNFTLNHVASYITFLPFTSQGVVAGAKITKIKVSADQAICGQFDFNDNGLDINSRPTPTPANKSIELAVSNFSIPTSANATINATTMVIAPGNYTNFTVEYTLYDPSTGQSGTIAKTYPGTVSFQKGKNKRIIQDLRVTVYSPSYYKWSAGYTSGAPSANEMFWYAMRGDPRRDNILWAMNGRLYAGGLWFKKISVIAAENPGNNLKAYAPDGRNYNSQDGVYGGYIQYSVTPGRPEATELNKYFFLPYLGDNTGVLGHVGIYCSFWSSTTIPNYWGSGHDEFYMTIDYGRILMRYVDSDAFNFWRFCVFKTGWEDQYRPYGF